MTTIFQFALYTSTSSLRSICWQYTRHIFWIPWQFAEMADCKCHLASCWARCLGQALSNDQTKWVQLCWGHKPPPTFTAWLDRCRFWYLSLYQEKVQNFSVLWVRLHQFRVPPELPPVAIAHLEYSAAATAKHFHFLPPESLGSVSKSNSDKCWGGAAGVRASNSHTASLQPLLKFTPGTPAWDVAPEGQTAFRGSFSRNTSSAPPWEL